MTIMYRNFEHLKEDFLNDNISFTDTFNIKETDDALSPTTISAVYQITTENMQENVTFEWTNDNGTLIPLSISIHESENPDTSNDKSNTDDTEQENIIGDVVFVKFSNFQAAPIKALVDSGATVSSLHVDQYKVKGNKISFISKILSDNIITVPIDTWQSVSTADNGIENRPIIKLSISINDVIIEDAMFNLNDRSKMKYPILIGQNILEKTDFLIDPKINDDGEIKQEVRSND